jgi:hypothetical protein
MAYKDDFKKEQERIKPIVTLWFKRLYVIAGNCYAWFWFVRQVFVRRSGSFEEYLMWAFLTFGFYWFIHEHTEIFINTDKDKN